jgi:hypothetical protein
MAPRGFSPAPAEREPAAANAETRRSTFLDAHFEHWTALIESALLTSSSKMCPQSLHRKS